MKVCRVLAVLAGLLVYSHPVPAEDYAQTLDPFGKRLEGSAYMNIGTAAEARAGSLAEVTATHLGSTLWSGIGHVDVSADYAYCAMPFGLMILDVSDPAVPSYVSQLYFESGPSSNRIVVSGPRAYVTDGFAVLRIVDISSPATPVLSSTYIPPYQGSGVDSPPPYALDVAISGSYAYVALGYDGFDIVDVSDPAAPTLVMHQPYRGYFTRIALSGAYAFVLDADSQSLRIFDVSDPASIVLVGTHPFVYGVAPTDLSVSGNYALLCGGYDDGEEPLGEMYIVDVANPSSPFLAGIRRTTGKAIEVETHNNLVYLIDQDNGTLILDISTPSTPQQVGHFAGVATALDFESNRGYFAVTSRLSVVDVSDPANVEYLGAYDMPASLFGVAIEDGYAFVGAWNRGLQVVNANDPALPFVVGSVATPGTASAVALSDGFAYIAARGTGGLQIADVLNPDAAAYVAGYTGPWAMDVCVAGDHAFVADLSSGLQIINVFDPSSPFLEGSYGASPGSAYGVAISGNLVFLAAYLSGLQVLDVSDPTSPALVGSYNTPGAAFGVTVVGTVAYVADGTAGLQVLDVSDPATPTSMGSYDTPGEARDVTVFGRYACVSDDLGGLQFVDVFDPSAPTLAGSYAIPSLTWSTAIAGDRAYVASSGGLLVLSLNVTFTAGDVNDDGSITSSDIVYLIDYVFRGGPAPSPVAQSGDANCDERITVVDIVLLVNHVFRGGPAPSCS